MAAFNDPPAASINTHVIFHDTPAASNATADAFTWSKDMDNDMNVNMDVDLDVDWDKNEGSDVDSIISAGSPLGRPLNVEATGSFSPEPREIVTQSNLRSLLRRSEDCRN